MLKVSLSELMALDPTITLPVAKVKRVNKPSGYWTLELVQADALLYATKKQWREQNPRSYGAACRFGLDCLNECSKHMPPPTQKGKKKVTHKQKRPKAPKSETYWSRYRCNRAAKLYKSELAFKTMYYPAWVQTKKNGWLEITEHMNI